MNRFRSILPVKLLVPILWEIAFIIVIRLLPTRSLPIYFVFYVGLIWWFRHDYSFRQGAGRLKDLRGFWLPVVLTMLGMVLCYECKTRILQRFLFMIPDGAVNIWMSDSYSGILFYGLTTIFIGPIAEELFFRQAILSWPDGGMEGDTAHGGAGRVARMACAVALSLILCGLTHATGWLGILEAALMVLPLTIAYLRTRDIHIPMLVHIAFELYVGFPSVLYVLVRLSLR